VTAVCVFCLDPTCKDTRPCDARAANLVAKRKALDDARDKLGEAKAARVMRARRRRGGHPRGRARRYVLIIDSESGKVVKRMGPMTARRADRVDDGANINLNHARFHTEIVTGADKRATEAIP